MTCQRRTEERAKIDVPEEIAGNIATQDTLVTRGEKTKIEECRKREGS
jgi:hypothetical protein